VGDAAPGGLQPVATSPTMALPLWVDWLDGRTGALLNSTAVRSVSAVVAGVRQRACTLGAGQAGVVSFSADGLPSNSADGRLAVWPCYHVAAGSTLSFTSMRTIAVLGADGSVDTRIGGTGSTGGAAGAGTGWRQVATLDGSAYWTASVGASNSGIRYIPQPVTAFDASVPVAGRGAPGGTAQPGYNDVRGLVLAPGRDGVVRLWGSSSGLDGATWATVFSLGGASAPLPRTAATTALAPLPGLVLSAGTAPWGFVLDATSGWVWLSADRTGATSRGVLQGWARSGTTWARQRAVTVTADPLRSLTGRDELAASGGGRSYVVYAASSRGVWRYDTGAAADGAATLIARPPAGTQFRGVVLPPAPGASPTPSRTVVKSAAPTRTRSPTRSATAKRKQG
jgi:hypothetical protein